MGYNLHPYNYYYIFPIIIIERTSLIAQQVKNLPAMQKTGVQSLAWKGPMEKGMATHCSILAWSNLAWLQRVGHN